MTELFSLYCTNEVWGRSDVSRATAKKESYHWHLWMCHLTRANNRSAADRPSNVEILRTTYLWQSNASKVPRLVGHNVQYVVLIEGLFATQLNVTDPLNQWEINENSYSITTREKAQKQSLIRTYAWKENRRRKLALMPDSTENPKKLFIQHITLEVEGETLFYFLSFAFLILFNTKLDVKSTNVLHQRNKRVTETIFRSLHPTDSKLFRVPPLSIRIRNEIRLANEIKREKIIFSLVRDTQKETFRPRNRKRIRFSTSLLQTITDPELMNSYRKVVRRSLDRHWLLSTR